MPSITLTKHRYLSFTLLGITKFYTYRAIAVFFVLCLDSTPHLIKGMPYMNISWETLLIPGFGVRQLSIEQVSEVTILQLAVVLLAARVASILGVRFLGQTAVAGEILGGILLGPTALGHYFPNFFSSLFIPQTWPMLKAFSELGLILLMFQVGLEFEVKKIVGRKSKTLILISAAGILFPFICGYFAAPFFFDGPRQGGGFVAFRLFFSTAISITAIPILGRIFIELGLADTELAGMAIGAAALDDIFGWLALAAVTAYATSAFNLGAFLWKIAALIGYAFFVVKVIARPLARWMNKRIKTSSQLPSGVMNVVFILLFLLSFITARLGVFAIIGAFLFGLSIQGDNLFLERWRAQVGKIASNLLIPVFFVCTGLRMRLDGIFDGHAVWQVMAIILIAFSTKFFGVYFAARISGENNRDAIVLGVCMNTRALMELVVLNVGYDLGILSPRIFTFLTIMAIASTFIATPLIRRLLKPELQERSVGLAAL
jgi:Kef-type K+ transport system membrane component KefB